MVNVLEAVQRPLCRIPDAAKYLGVSEPTIFRLIQAGRLPVVKIGRSTRLRYEDLNRFIGEQLIGNDDDAA